jgi:hypothetical protein
LLGVGCDEEAPEISSSTGAAKNAWTASWLMMDENDFIDFIDPVRARRFSLDRCLK